MYQVTLSKKARKGLKRIPKKIRTRINSLIQSLQDDPYRGKQLLGEFEGSFSVRIWPYRIIYIIKREEKVILIIDIGHRQGIYK